MVYRYAYRSGGHSDTGPCLVTPIRVGKKRNKLVDNRKKREEEKVEEEEKMKSHKIKGVLLRKNYLISRNR